MSVAEGGGPVVSLVTVNRARCAGPFSDEEMARVARLRPHLVNTYAICRRLGVLQDEAASLRARLDRVPIGILLLDGDGRIVDRNAEAVRLLAGHRSVVGERGGVLHFAPASHQARYQAALVRLRCSHPAPRPEAIVVGGEARAAAGALVLHLCALPAGTGQALHRRARVLAFLSELDRHAEGRFAEAMLRAALELTPMEATVVLALREHHDPLQVAVALGLALSTVRSHLKHAFRKTGTTRQGELLRLVDRVLSAAPS